MGEIKIDLNACVGDGICAEKCPMGVLEITMRGRKKWHRLHIPSSALSATPVNWSVRTVR